MMILKQLSVISNSCVIDSELVLIALRNSSLSMKNGRPLHSLFRKLVSSTSKAIELAVDCLMRNDALTECVCDASGSSAHVVVLAPLIVDDCLKLGLTYHG